MPSCASTLLPGIGVHDPVDDHAIVLVQAGLDHAQSAAQIAGLDRLGNDGAVGGHRHDHVLRLIEHHRGVRHQKGRRGRRDRNANARKLARHEEQIPVGHGGAHVNCPAGAIEGVVDKVERAGADEAVLVAEAESDLIGERSGHARTLARKGEVVGFAHVEVEIDRIERHQRGEQGGGADAAAAAGDQAADGDERARRCGL